MSNILSKLNYFETLFADCVFEHRYVSRSTDESLGGIWNGDPSIVAVTSEKFTRALSLDGDGDFINYGSIMQFPTAQDLSIEVVIKPAISGDNFQRIIDKSTGGNGANGYSLAIRDDGVIFHLLGGDAVATNTTVSADTWVHIISTVDGTNEITYKNGGSADSSANGFNIGSGSSNLYVGSSPNLTDREYNGEIDLIRLWKRVLTAAEVLQLSNTEGF